MTTRREPPRTVVRALRVSEAVAPGVAASFAERQWWRIAPPPPLERRSRAVGLPGERVRITSRHLDLTAHVFGPVAGPTAYVVHGWGGWWQQFATLIAALADCGYRVVAYDAPSHGESGPGRYGTTTRVMEMAEAYGTVVERFGPSRLTVAHSVGAMAAMWAHESGTPTDSYLWLSPATRMEPMIDFLATTVGLGPRSRLALTRRIERTMGRPLADFDVSTMTGRIDPTSPPRLLAIHDRGDARTSAADTEQLLRQWPGARFRAVDGPGHNGVLRHPGSVAAARAFARAGISGRAA